MSAEDNGGDPDQTVPVFFLFFAALLALVLLLGRALHDRPRLNSYLSEPALTLLVSALVSFLVKATFPEDDDDEANAGRADDGRVDDEYDGFYDMDAAAGGEGWEMNVDQSRLSRFLLTFSGEAFFMVFLPPIMFNSGYELQRELFFRHIKPIVSFAVVGTALAGVVTGLVLLGLSRVGVELWQVRPLGGVDATVWELLTFGSLITATDTVSVLGVLNAKKVDPHLFSLVFGESAFNDAVAIVLYRTFGRLVRTGGVLRDEALRFAMEFLLDVLACPLLGLVLSVLAALVFKRVGFRGTPVLELSLYLIIMYFPFLLAEVLGMSGIITIFVTGMSARRYIEPNVSDETRRNAEVIFHLVAYLAETCIFLNLGLSVFGFRGSFHWSFIGCAFLASLVGRALSVYSISFLHNWSLTHWVEEPHKPRMPPPKRLRSTVTVALERAAGRDVQGFAVPMSTAAPEAGDTPGWEGWDGLSGPSGEEDPSAQDQESPGRTRRVRRTPDRRLDKVIPPAFMHFLWFAGLRGAVAYACARDFPDVNGNQSEVVAATMVIVFFSVIVMGACCEPLLYCLSIQMGVDDEEYMREWRNRRQLDGRFHRFEKRFIYNMVVRQHPVEDDVELEEKPFHLVGNDGSAREVMAMERATVRWNSISKIECKDSNDELAMLER